MMKVYQQLMGKIRRASHAMVQHIPEFLKKRTKNNAVVFVDEKRVLQYQKALDNDPLLYKAIDILMQERARDSRAEATTTLFWRNFKIGYSKAVRLIESMEALGIIGEYVSQRHPHREMLLTISEWNYIKSCLHREIDEDLKERA